MSLLDPIAVCDAVLETVMQQDVHIAIRTDNPGNATPIGSGTVSNPYGGPENAGDWFDYTMTNKVGANRTVRIGPGTFRTKGSQAWSPQSGQRIVGSGMAETALKLANVGSVTGEVHAVGPDTIALEGFELTDLKIDANYAGQTGSAVGVGGVNVRGNSVFIDRVRVVNFGHKAEQPIVLCSYF